MASLSLDPWLLLDERDKTTFGVGIVAEPGPLSPIDLDSPPSTASKRSWSSENSSDSAEKQEWNLSASPKRTRRLSKPLPPKDALFPFLIDNGTFVDNTRFILALPERFDFLLLLPPRFGKSVLQSELHAFYDIREASHFEHRFNSLAVVRDAPPNRALQHNQHLVFHLKFASFAISEADEYFGDVISFAMDLACASFLQKYGRQELRLREDGVKDALRGNDIFPNIIDIVKRAGCSMLVTVDDFDGAFRTPPSAFNRKREVAPQTVAAIFDAKVWAPIRHGVALDVIHKLFVTGTTLPILHDLPSQVPHTLSVLLGFPEGDALRLAQAILGEPVDERELRRICGSYAPWLAGGPTPDPAIFHPQMVLEWIAQQAELDARRDPNSQDHTFALLADILSTLPPSVDDPRLPSLEGLIQLLATGKVVVDDMDAYLENDPLKPTWAALHYAGALHRDSHSGCCRISTYQALACIHSHLDAFLDRRQCYCTGAQLKWHWRDFWESYRSGNLLGAITDVLRDAMRLSRFSAPEPNLFGVLELVLRRHDVLAHSIAPLLALQDDSNDDGRICIPQGDPDEDDWSWLFLDVQTLSLVELWHGRHANEDGRSPTPEELNEFFDELVGLDEAALLKLACRASTADGISQLVSVESYFREDHDAPQLLAVGGARVLLRWQSGVTECEDPGEQSADDDVPY
ncbi:AAA-ATPase-like domain-containing protein [Mycena chlorophos]|uniref:AAA-ATPase-like domain-containing protein n=1 Tax=Mycena chlorophos TaxID=658473 RepID=A0A8H6TRI6_MYCCL|nr:AAA-ATPase-like domain-containing protein [Mycena chlorophos]